MPRVDLAKRDFVFEFVNRRFEREKRLRAHSQKRFLRFAGALRAARVYKSAKPNSLSRLGSADRRCARSRLSRLVRFH